MRYKKDEHNTIGFPLILLCCKNTITYFVEQGTASFFTLSSPDGYPGCGVHAQGAAPVYCRESIIGGSPALVRCFSPDNIEELL